MQFKEGNLQFTEELKFTDDYGRFSKAEMSNFSDPGNMENRKPDQKNLHQKNAHPQRKSRISKKKMLIYGWQMKEVGNRIGKRVEERNKERKQKLLKNLRVRIKTQKKIRATRERRKLPERQWWQE